MSVDMTLATDTGAVAAIGSWLSSNASRIILLLTVALAAAVASKVLLSILRHALDRSNIPSVSIFINLTRVLIWTVAVAIVLQPVFGINPTTLITALGIGGLALSLGLKDTIANVIGGFGLMMGHVIHPGDLVTIAGTTGTVTDITWRQTVLVERNGNRMVIPNSVLNTSALERIVPANEACVDIPFTIKAGTPVAEAERRVIDSVGTATNGMTRPSSTPLVRFSGFSPYGIEGRVLVFAKEGVLASTLRDAAVRALADADFIEQRAAIGE
ncbi:mechanosensitive ion channel domain-containing protein [uncultured Bifidobacterium sp.]|uniref:mechanosensitive ion channel family protein n=1 Tax=uncultured Bifidobacterium sp. TaxID=165187 RepID=UPI0026034C7E|nr:mechanosensitive ion channel domain-containing protein [uncultured Bifidobacterium sp.]